jgi:pimeloyl-ACP methyl ester carboxylesterase
MNPVTGPAGTPTTVTPPARRPRLRRWARRLVIAVAATLSLVTCASFGYNALTAGRATPPAGQVYVQAADVRTRYRVWGTTGSPIVLVHGAFESADTWSRLAPLLAHDHRVYALDLTGAGYSTRRGPYTAGHLAAQLRGFLDAMDLGASGRRPLLVAHSSGAAVAAEATLRAPGRIGGLLMLDGDALNTGAGARTPIGHVLFNPYRTSLLRLGLRSDRLIRIFYNAQCGPSCPPLDHAGVQVWRRPYQVAGGESGLWGSLAAGNPGLPAARVSRLRESGVPASVVFGADDDLFSKNAPAQTAGRIGAPPPTLIPGGRHLTMISDPVAVAAAVEALAVRARH